MSRPLLFAVLVLAAVPALAEESHATSKAPVSKSANVRDTVKPQGTQAAPTASHASALRPLDEVISTQCRGFEQSGCSKSRAVPDVRPTRSVLFEQLGGKSGALELPKDARRDASAGIFI